MRMKALTIVAVGAIVLVSLFGCSPAAAPEAPVAETPAAEGGAPPDETPSEEPPAPPAGTPAAPDVGLSRDDPVPLGQTITAVNGATLTVHGISSRGAEATDLVMQWDASNWEPEEGNEYVMISLTIGYEGGEEDTLYVGLTDFTAVVEGRTTIAAPSFFEGGDILSGEVSPGQSMDGVVVFEVPEGASGSLLTYTVFSQQSYYFATE